MRSRKTDMVNKSTEMLEYKQFHTHNVQVIAMHFCNLFFHQVQSKYFFMNHKIFFTHFNIKRNNRKRKRSKEQSSGLSNKINFTVSHHVSRRDFSLLRESIKAPSNHLFLENNFLDFFFFSP